MLNKFENDIIDAFAYSDSYCGGSQLVGEFLKFTNLVCALELITFHNYRY